MILDSVSLYYGKSWTGKTVRMLHDLRSVDRAVIVDAKCAQLAQLKRWKHLWTEFDGERWTTVDVIDFFRSHLSAPFRVVIHVRHGFREQLEMLCRVLLAVGNCVVAVDELSLFLPSSPKLPECISAVVVSGTHEGIRFWGTAQRPSLVHPTIRSNATKMTIFRMIEQNELDAVKPYLPERFLSELPTLPDQVPICWADGQPPFIDCTLTGKLADLVPDR